MNVCLGFVVTAWVNPVHAVRSSRLLSSGILHAFVQISFYGLFVIGQPGESCRNPQ
ncbi:hypothetical protein EMIT048CA2_50342 [Pseudomonas chlororaphis]